MSTSLSINGGANDSEDLLAASGYDERDLIQDDDDEDEEELTAAEVVQRMKVNYMHFFLLDKCYLFYRKLNIMFH